MVLRPISSALSCSAQIPILQPLLLPLPQPQRRPLRPLRQQAQALPRGLQVLQSHRSQCHPMAYGKSPIVYFHANKRAHQVGAPILPAFDPFLNPNLLSHKAGFRGWQKRWASDTSVDDGICMGSNCANGLDI